MKMDYLQEIEETGGVKCPIFHESGVFAESPKSTDVSLSVFIDAENDKNSYIIEFSHSIDNWFKSIDKTEKFENLVDAILRFEQVNSVIHNILMDDSKANKNPLDKKNKSQDFSR